MINCRDVCLQFKSDSNAISYTSFNFTLSEFTII